MSHSYTGSNLNSPDDLNLQNLQNLSIESDTYIKSPRSSSSYTNNINADIQAKLLAFQEQRQSKSTASSPLQENKNDFDNIELTRNRSFKDKPLPPLPNSNPSSSFDASITGSNNNSHSGSIASSTSSNSSRFTPNTPRSTNNESNLSIPLNKLQSAPPIVPNLSNNHSDRFLNPSRPAPALPINSQLSPQVAARLPKQKQSLSQRRGMKFPNGLPSLNQQQTQPQPKSQNLKLNSIQTDPNNSITSIGSDSGDINQPNTTKIPNNDNTTRSKLPNKPPSATSSISEILDKKGKLPRQQSLQLKGLFANYAEYIDIKSGSLNFADKLSLDSNGVNFQSGQHFSISAKDLEFIEELGRGNYGTVSKVLHKPSNVIMAMKEVRLELDDSKFRQILMELQVLHNCDSPYIVDFFGAFFVEGAVYMCMEYMDAGSLDKIYGSGIDESHLAFITKSITQGLKELKERHNIIHRDVKPTNILINTKGKVKLCDFGVSGNLVASLAKTNIGCQSYMAPERIKSLNPDDVRYSVQSDVWSLGLTILETAKGCYPYPPETFDNIFSQLSAIVEGQPPELPDTFSPIAKNFVKLCLEKNPEKRPVYSNLLLHPWLNKFETDQKEMALFVQSRLNELEDLKIEQNAKDYEELNSRLQKKTPALHRGGAPTN